MELLRREGFRFLISAALGLVAAIVIWGLWPDSSLYIGLVPMLVALAVRLLLGESKLGNVSRGAALSSSQLVPSQYQRALSAAGVGSLLWDLARDEIRCTDDVFNIIGRSGMPSSLSAEEFEKAIHPEDRDAFRMAVEWVKSGKRRSPFDCRFVKSSGGVVWVEFTMCLVDEGSSAARIAGAMTDVTERKRVEAQLDRGVAYLEAILENTKNLVFSIDSDFRLTVLNSRFKANFRALIGKSVHVGDDIFEISSPEIADKWKPLFLQVLEGESRHVEEVFSVKGKTYYFDVSLKPIREGGRVTGVTVYGRNITQQKIREREWVEAKERAEESDRLKSAFLANMSHEIRTPLNAVMGFAQLLKTGGGSDEEREKFLDIILSNGNHLLKILGDIIELAKIESNQLRMEPVVVDLSMLLSEIYSAFHDRIRIDANEQLELIVDNSMEVPDCIMCDETRLKQVVYNLVSNSVKFTERGSIHLGYERKKGGMVEFYVADTGPGVPDDMRERIFKRFRQGVPSSGRRNDGVGLGLSICEGLVTLLGGKIWLEQNLPNGSVFRFSVRDQRDRIRPRQIAARIESKPIDRNLADVEIRKGSKILVAEDDDMNFHVIDEFLRKEKLVAMRAHNGEEAVSLVEQDQDIKLVVMDLGMPVLNGLEATKRIKLIRPELTVIAHTAHAMKKDLDKAIDAGCSDCLVKPISIERFKRMLARYA